MSDAGQENVSYYEALAREYPLFFSDLDRNMQEEGDWLTALLRSFGVHTVLDASCGAGRQSVPLCERGFAVTAADPSGAMLRAAHETARERGVSFPILNAGFEDLTSHISQAFDAVIALGNGLCNLTRPDDIQAALRAMYTCCRPGGICLIGIKDFAAIRPDGERFHGHRIVDDAGRRTILFEVWDVEEPVLTVTAYLIEHSQAGNAAGVRLARTHEYMLREVELRRMAHASGFKGVRRLDRSSEATYVLSA